jgi:murein DD-endopeptidase MepM/ murein hydrolase activator NlpD
MKTIAMLILLTFPLAAAAWGQNIELGLPIRCELGKDCWVQQYFDRDKGPGTRDYHCGAQAYDGHDGIDIRIRDTEAKADVLASAPGVVSGVRDEMDDRLIRSAADRAAIKDRECGNGVLIDHEGGWRTQYCHMRRGTIVVKQGDSVERGQKLGEVGYSGLAAFPHVHLASRKGKTAVDPFRAGEGDDQCGEALIPLWSAEALKALAYREGEIIGLGFAPGKISLEEVEEGRTGQQTPEPNWEAVVAYGWAINLKQGDVVTISLRSPDRADARNSITLDRNKAQYMLFAGKKRPAGGWPKGEYLARFSIANGAVERLTQETRFNFD